MLPVCGPKHSNREQADIKIGEIIMNLSKLKEALRPWMKNDTWNSGHPCDNERFHQALNNAFSDLGTSIHGSDFKEVMLELAKEYYPKMIEDYRHNEVQRFVIHAEHITTYLQDTK
jgi:hypothetical protein